MISINTADDGVKVQVDVQARTVSVTFRDAAKRIEVNCVSDFGAVDDFTEAYLHRIDAAARASQPVSTDDIGTVHFRAMPVRLKLAMSYYTERLQRIAGWLVSSRETTNFTYGLTDISLGYLSHVVAVTAGIDQPTALAYIKEPLADAELLDHLHRLTTAHSLRWCADDRPQFGRRLGWYAIVRARKPAVLVETGVDKGMGSVLLCAALRRNAAEGRAGVYYGTDINPAAGYLLTAPYAEHGRILYGDSIQSLIRLEQPIDIFINDSDHSVEYERREYATIQSKLAPGSMILGDNSGHSPALMEFAQVTGRRFLFYREEPRDHWYPGGGIGIAY
ncbi:class I SAM-dependent methyltransferase [Azospirillum sp.]|uniref:class I SAM-dependent methyltransferase n=1 Tax=Azospirillum sp. TaxID=34012 RepID=UPI002D66B0B0|nr:class I SAM-dependent methyltransferase [Azospirillum sp.]HYD70504.1 class I SAM-dependent methyltransferase [Azospirillum sp.]